jgi:uncharacterized protein YdcH (DUF465 family)
MTTGGNGTYGERYWDQLDHRLQRIEESIDRLADQHGNRHDKLSERITELEHTGAAQAGGWKVVTIIGSVAGVVGGFATKWFG